MPPAFPVPCASIVLPSAATTLLQPDVISMSPPCHLFHDLTQYSTYPFPASICSALSHDYRRLHASFPYFIATTSHD